MTNVYHNKNLFNAKDLTKIKTIIKEHVENECMRIFYYINTKKEKENLVIATQEIQSKISTRLAFQRLNPEQKEYINLVVDERWHTYSRGPKGQKDFNYMVQSDKIGWTLQDCEFNGNYEKLGKFIDSCNDERIISRTFNNAVTQNFEGSILYLLNNKKYVPDFTMFEYTLLRLNDNLCVKLAHSLRQNNIDIHQNNNLLLCVAICEGKEKLQEFILESFTNEQDFLSMVKIHKMKKSKTAYAYCYLQKKLLTDKLERHLEQPTASSKRMKV